MLAGTDSVGVALRVPARESWIVEPRSRDGQAQGAVWTTERARTLPRAILGGAILLVMPGSQRVWRVNLQIPVFAAGPVSPGTALEAFATIDFARAFTSYPPEGSYFAYLVCGGLVKGPYETTIVERDDDE